MRFEPKSEEELNPVFPKGEYEAQVKVAEEKVSKKGNPMIQLGIMVWGPNGQTNMVNDYLLESTLAKLLHFCEAAGLRELYDAGELEDWHCVGKTVIVKLDIDDNPEYGAKNVVKGYVSKEAKEKHKASRSEHPFREANKELQQAVKSGHVSAPVTASATEGAPPEDFDDDDSIPF